MNSDDREMLDVARRVCTQKQVQVLELVARGMSQRAVGMALGIGRETVRGHMDAGMARVRATTGGEAA